MNKNISISILISCIGLLFIVTEFGNIGVCESNINTLQNTNSLVQDTDLLSIVKSDSSFLILQFKLPEIEIKEIQQNGESVTHVWFDGADWTLDNGKPKLPVYTVPIGLPSSGQSSTIIVNKNRKYKKIKHPLITQRLIDPLIPHTLHDDSSTLQDNKAIEKKNTSLYPQELVEVIPAGFVRAQRVGGLHINPIQFNNLTNQLIITDEITIRIDFYGTTPPVHRTLANTLSDSIVYENLFQNMLVNHRQAFSWRLGQNRGQRSSIGAAPSVAKTQRRRFKMSISRSDMFRITYRNLISGNVVPEDIDLDSISVETNGNPQGFYIFDKNENETFDSDDMLVFYARSLSNKFTDTNVYWFSFLPKGVAGDINNTESDKTIRVTTRSVEPETRNVTPPTSFLSKQRYEKDVIHDVLDGVNIKSELADHYFWTGFRGRNIPESRKNFPIDLVQAVPRENIERNATVRVRLQGASYKGAALHRAKIQINGKDLGDLEEWRRQDAVTATRDIEQKFVHHNHTNILRIDSIDNNGTPAGSHDFYLDWYEIQYWRNFNAELDRLEFNSRTDPFIEGVIHFRVGNLSSDIIDVYKLNQDGLTEKLTNGNVARDGGKYRILFQDEVNEYTTYFTISNNSYASIGKLTEVPHSTLRNPTNQADYIVITHKTFLDSVKPLVDFRSKQGLTVKVVDIDEIYDEFSAGLFFPVAIQRFLKYTYDTWKKPAPTYVLLVGDAHYDYKGVIVQRYLNDPNFHGNYNLYPIFVPTYHAWAPASGETAMDQRFVNVSGSDALPDMFIGRLSVQTTKDLDEMIQKIIDYEENPKIGPWQATIVQVADDNLDNPSDEIFESSRDALVEEIIPFSYHTKQIYLRKIRSPEKTKSLILDAIDEGAVVLEYAGHGGIHTWADESILHIKDTENLRNKYLPFIITTTCLNGEFDKPQQFGSHSLSEQFLLGKYGAIGSLSATRLTYAEANRQFDRDLFISMFQRTPLDTKNGGQLKIPQNPTLGKVITDAKINFITRTRNPQWILGAEQYTLFGDPATRLALPKLDIRVELEDLVLNDSKKIVIKNNDVGRLDTENTWWRIEDFSTENLLATAIFHNHFDDIQGNEIFQRIKNRVWKGEYGTIRINIPKAAVPGRGVVQLLAYDDTRMAIGGAEYWVKTPIISKIVEDIDTTDTHTLSLHVLVVDDVPDGKGINNIHVVWDDTVEYKDRTIIMERTNPPPGQETPTGGKWFKLQSNIPLPHGGKTIRYLIRVTDNTGLVVRHPEKNVRKSVNVPEGPNIYIGTDGSSIPPIRYSYDDEVGKYVLIAELLNNGGRTVNVDIDLVFSEGNPDKEGDLIVDPDANIIGVVTVTRSDWEDAETALQHALIKLYLDKNLATGLHKVYVLADPETDSESEPVMNNEDVDQDDNIKRYKGNIAEPNDYDNKKSVSFIVNEFFYEPNKPLSAFSLDRVFDLDIPDSVGKFDSNRIALSVSSSAPYTLTQPEMKFAPIPRVAALRRGLLRTGEDRSQQYEVSFRASDVKLDKPITLKLRFDISGIEDVVRENTPWKEGSKFYNEALIQEAEKLGIYTWQPTYEKWKRLPSQVSYVSGTNKPNPEDEGPLFKLDSYITPVQTENANKQPLLRENIKINSDLTPAATWVIMFMDSNQYEVYRKDKHLILVHKLDKIGYLDIPYREETYGIEFLIPSKWNLTPDIDPNTPIVPFEFGDILIFVTDHSGEGGVILRDTRNQNVGNGTAVITPRLNPKEEFEIGDWFLFFTSREYYEIRDKTGSPIILPNDEKAEGRINETLYLSHLGMEINVTSSSVPFTFGDKIKFSSAWVGTITAETTELNPFTLISNEDTTPPKFNLWVDGLEAQVGSVIAPRPLISILLEDVSGIDLDKLVIRRGDNGKPLQPITDHKLRNPKNVHTIPIDYKPILFPGEYAFEIEAYDYNGIPIGGDEGKVVTRFTVVDFPDIEPPVIEVLVNEQELSVQEVLQDSITDGNMDDSVRISQQPNCKILITDDIALDDTLFSISFNRVTLDDTTRRYREFDSATWVFDEENPINANFSFAPDLENGTYRLQVSATDTSENTTEIETFFTLDEAVTLSEVFNVPNPIEKGKTFFTYQLAQPSDAVTIKIYTVNGRLIRTIEDGSAARGANETFWDGRDQIGIKCANGVYLYRVIAHTGDEKVEKIGKLAILR
ncbi:hypothetical protein JT359_14555 [Candidatus Poribacteria bacterium]|nr:hypothetical protein [Candidatus Poribacteria bacterium]